MFTDKNKIFTVKGHVIDQKTRKGVKGLRVEVWDKDRVSKNDYLGSAETDTNGYFEYSFSESQFRELFFDRKPDLYFEVLCGKDLITSTENEVDWDITQHDYELKRPIEVNSECIPIANDSIYRVFGMVHDVNNNSSLPKYTIRAFDRDNQLKETQLGLAQTDQAAFYQIEFKASAIKEIDPTRNAPNLFVRVYSEKNEKIGESIQVDNAGLTTELNVDITLYRVSGTITDSNGKLLRGKTVKVFDRDLRSAELLGITVTDARGHYEISYNQQKFSRAEKDKADLEIQVDDGDQVIKSETQFNASADTIINLVVPIAGIRLSEFELLLKEILPLLNGQGENGHDLAIEALQPHDAEFLAKDANQPIERINWLIIATKLSKEPLTDNTVTSDTSLNSIPPAVFYAWLRKGLPEKISDLRQEVPTTLRRNLLEAIDEFLVPEILKDQVDAFISLLGHTQWKEVNELIQVLSLDPEKQKQLSQRIDSLDGIEDMVLTGLVQSEVLTEVEANRFGLAVSLQRLIQFPINKLPSLLQVVPPKLGRLLNKSEDLARLHPNDWVKLMTESGIVPPANQSIEEYAGYLEEIAANAYPTLGLLHRSARAPDNLEANFDLVKPKLSSLKNFVNNSICSICNSDSGNNDPLARLWKLSLNDPAFSEIVPSLSLGQQKAIGEIQNFVRAHPGIDAHLPLGELQKVGTRWIESLDKLIRINANKDLLALDLTVFANEPLTIDFADLPREPLLRELKSMQRMLSLAETPSMAHKLIQAGMYSATQLALLPKEKLLAQINLDRNETNKLHEKARIQANKTAVAYFSAKDSMQTQRLLKGGVSIGELNQFDQVSKLFGNLDACECAHCLSVLSPAAYFVDLMYYVEINISSPTDTNRSLKKRRPDLWTLELSCDSTSTIVPTLDIVNRTLENWLKEELNVSTSVDVFNEIAAPVTITSFNLPFNFPLQRLEILLAHFGLSRDRIGRVLQWEGQQRIKTRLQLTHDEVSLITASKTFNMSTAVRDFFAQLYNFSPNSLHGSDADALISESITDLSHFQHITKVDRNILRALVLSKFVSKDGTSNKPVEVVMLTTEDNVQNNIEKVRNLSLRRLDRLHRMIRLWRKLPWTVNELDYVLIRLAIDHSLTPAELTLDILENIVKLLDLADRTSLPVDELMSLSSAIPDIGLRGDESLFNRRFNTEPFVTRDGDWQAEIGKLSIEMKHPAYSPEGVSEPDQNTLMRLLAALQIDDSQFLSLVQGLASVPVDAQGNTLLTKKDAGQPTERQVIKVTLQSLYLLYRYARLAHVLGVKIPELLRLIDLALTVENTVRSGPIIESISDVFAILNFVEAQKASGYELQQIEWLLNPARIPSGTQNASDIAASVVRRFLQERLAIVSATTLTTAGFTESESIQILKDLSQSMLDVSEQEGEYRFKPKIEFDKIGKQIEDELSAKLDFDVAAAAILSYAQHLGIFQDTAFQSLFLDENDSQKIVAENLVSATEPDKAFERIKKDPNANPLQPQPERYRINPAAKEVKIIADTGIAAKMVLGLIEKIKTEDSNIIQDTVFQGIYLTAQQSRWLVAANIDTGIPNQPRIFIKNLGGNGFIINPKFPTVSSATSFSAPVLDKLVTRQLTALLQQYHWQFAFDLAVGAELSVEPGKISAFRTYIKPASDIPEILLGLKSDSDHLLSDWIAQAQRLRCLVKDPALDTAAVREVLSYWPSLSASPSAKDLWNQILSTASYARWLRVEISDSEKAKKRRESLEKLLHTSAQEILNVEDVAIVLDVPVDVIRSANNIKPTTGEWFQKLDQYSLITGISTRLGVSGESLYRMLPLSIAREEVNNLWRAADDIHGAFRAKYQDGSIYQKKAEAFEDVIRGKRRDALVTFLLDKKMNGFQKPSDLYAYFLIDVEIGGCARTSELVAATVSLQLYVHRVLMGLEMSNSSERIIFKDMRKRREWSWRKHYRVWEANRKVFLFPENFIEPDLRDDKTPLFIDLENELLQRQITTAEAEQSYRKYLTGFSEVSSLKIVGAFHDNGKDQETQIEKDVLHLVGVTESDPPIHYLRAINNYKASRTGNGRPLQYGPWKKLEAQIPVKWVSPVVYQRKLMLFWTEITTVSTTRKIDNQRYFNGYEHKFKIKYIEQKPDGSWSAAQQLDFLDGASESKQFIQDALEFIQAPPENGEPPGWPLVKENSGLTYPIFGDLYSFLLESIKESRPDLGFPIPSVNFKAKPSLQATDNYSEIAHHSQPQESYTLKNWNWERVFPTIRIAENSGAEPKEILQIAAMNSNVHGFMPHIGRQIPFVSYNNIEVKNDGDGLLAAHITDSFSIFELSNQLLFSTSKSINPIGHHIWKSTGYLYSAQPSKTVSQLPVDTISVTRFSDPISDGLIVNTPAKVSSPGSNIAPYRADAILHSGSSQVLATVEPAINLVLLSSLLSSDILKQLGLHSIPGILNVGFQNSLNEVNPVQTYHINPEFGKGAFGTYVRETFFHIPFLIANHLNSQQRFSEAQQWYHYIFNPMDVKGNYWQYREFSSLTVESMRAMLTDPEALEAYRQNPFNPDAIARTRLSAYQKSIVMKYIDNLLDWGDRLFTQFTMESVNEATMLYILASDILGEKPAELPRCMEEKKRTYAQIRPSLSDVSDFLIEEINEVELTAIHSEVTGEIVDIYEPYVIPLVSTSNAKQTNSMQLRSVSAQIELEGQDFVEIDGTLGTDLSTGGTIWNSTTGTSLSELSLGNNQVLSELTAIGPDSAQLIGGNIDFVRDRYQLDPFATAISGWPPMNGSIPIISGLPEINQAMPNYGEFGLDGRDPSFHYEPANTFEAHQFDTVELISARNVFCFPQNAELLAYWNRVEDRLSKIRNCKDISGLRRQLDLFAPEIDPRELIRLKAAGLSLEDVMDITTGHAPPYRFAYLLDKARQYANTVQNLGGQLLAALEKRDAEELAAMRLVHEHQLQEMRTQLMTWEIDASQDALKGLEKQKEAIEYRKEHYENLVTSGLSGWEHAQSAATFTATSLSNLSAIHDVTAAIANFIPQIHGPTTTGITSETGGKTVAKSLELISSSFKTLASVADRIGGLAGMQAGFQRREEEWKHQITLATHDLAQIGKQIEAAEIRVSIAERSLEVHKKSIEQTQEIYDFYRNKFSKVGLYTWMSTQLHRLHRMAFNTAWSMARMAEKALHFERPDLRDTVTLNAKSWNAENAGILSGESLLLDLQRLEMRYLETNYREFEIEQAFSLALFRPDKLLDLQTYGECEFNIPEFFFDLHYPGHYRRRIKAVRLTIPCVVGPYNNVGATLTLTRSELRDQPKIDDQLKSIPLRYALNIATSSAQNDAGIFEFSFRDERYMPFEGMGAISTWKLTLPRKIRSFDYKTISDVILRINYTALEDSNLRDQIEVAMLGSFKKAAPSRLISVRHEFPANWTQFKTAQPNSSDRCELTLNIEPSDYPFWISTFIGDNFSADLIIDSDYLEKEKGIPAYKMASPPKSDSEEPVNEEKDIIYKPDANADGKTYHEGLLNTTKPQAAIGKWTIYFDSKDRDHINDLWLKISW